MHQRVDRATDLHGDVVVHVELRDIAIALLVAVRVTDPLEVDAQRRDAACRPLAGGVDPDAVRSDPADGTGIQVHAAQRGARSAGRSGQDPEQLPRRAIDHDRRLADDDAIDDLIQIGADLGQDRDRPQRRDLRGTFSEPAADRRQHLCRHRRTLGVERHRAPPRARSDRDLRACRAEVLDDLRSTAIPSWSSSSTRPRPIAGSAVSSIASSAAIVSAESTKPLTSSQPSGSTLGSASPLRL